MLRQELIEDIRSKADIVQVISSYGIDVVKKGKDYVAICPFHQDTHPSMSISVRMQIFKCFACGTAGNVFGFVQQYEKIGFEAAVRKVAKIIGYSSPELDERIAAPRVDEEKRRLLSCIDDLQKYYATMLRTEEGKAAVDYLASRQIDSICIERYGIGYSPKDGKMTADWLLAKDHSPHDIEGIGVALMRNNSISDSNAGRVIFPIKDADGQVVGFSARRIEDDGSAKYKNSPETRIFVKSRILYNYDKAAIPAKREGYVYLLEGFMDVIALNRSGIEPAVALMGTSLTAEHIQMLRRLGCEVRVALDGDAPGQQAMMKIASALSKAKIAFRLVDSGDDKRDPDDLFRQEGAEAVKRRMAKLVDNFDFALGFYANTHSLETSQDKTRVVEAFIPYLNSLPPGIEFENALVRLSKVTGYDPSAIRNLTRLTRGDALSLEEAKLVKGSLRRSLKAAPQHIERLITAERKVLCYLMESSQAADSYDSKIGNLYDEVNDRVANYILDYREAHPGLEKADASSILDFIKSQAPIEGDEDFDKEASSQIGELAFEDAIDSYTPDNFDECARVIDEEKAKLYSLSEAEKSLRQDDRATQAEKAKQLALERKRLWDSQINAKKP